MVVSENFADLRTTVEEQYLQEFTSEIPSDIYFELATIIAERTVKLEWGDSIVDILGTDVVNRAEQDARASASYAIGYRACVTDFSQGKEEELVKLMKQVRGI